MPRGVVWRAARALAVASLLGVSVLAVLAVRDVFALDDELTSVDERLGAVALDLATAVTVDPPVADGATAGHVADLAARLEAAAARSGRLGDELTHARWRANVVVAVALVGSAVGGAVGVVAWSRRRRRRIESFYRRVLDAIPDRVHLYRADDLRLEFCNRAWAEPFGRAPAALVGASLEDLLSADELAALRVQVPRLLAGEVGRDSIGRRTGPDGAEIVESWDDRLLERGGGLVVSVGRDVTARVAAEDEARIGRATLAAIVDAVPSGVVAVDRTGTVLAANRAVAELVRVELAPGTSLVDVDVAQLELRDVRGAPVAAADLPLVRALAGEEHVRLELVVVDREGGDDRPVVATGQPWRDERGEVAGAVVILHDVTEVKAAERQLRAILDAIHHGVLLHDGTGRVVEANATAAHLLGEPDAATLVGLPTDAVLSDALGADGRPLGSAFRPVSEAVTTGAPVGPVEVGVGLESERRWLRVAAEPVTTDAGPGAVVSFTDVTAEHDGRAALAESEARHRVVVEHLHEGLVVQAADGAIVSANAAAERILGLTGDQIAGRTSIDPRWHAVDGDGRPLPGERHPAMVTLRTGESVDGFLMGVHRPDGELRWIDVTSRPVPLPTGPGVFTVFHDLTETLAARSALVESEERFRSLADGAPVAVFTMGTDAGIDYANAALRELVRAPLRRFGGQRWLEFLVDDERDELVATAVHAAEHAVEVRREHHLVPLGGSPRFVSTTLRPIDGGRRLIGTVVDLTERRALERRLAHDATHDPLTGLANRALLLDRLAHSLHRGARSGVAPTLLFVDLDRFKPVNDAFGHAAGDHVLVVVAERLAAAVRTGDTVARLGGDEFLVLAEPPISRHEADALALRLLDGIMRPIALPDGGVVAVGASVGVAAGEVGDEPARLLARADSAVYLAKSDGRGRIHRARG